MFKRRIRIAFMNAPFLLGLAVLIQLNANLAVACFVDRSGPMPVCGSLNISTDTDIVIIEGHKTNLPSNVLLGSKKHSAETMNIVIGGVERPLMVVVSHYYATILNFSGNVHRVTQVVAMGARSLGWDHVAVAGIDPSKVSFVPVERVNRSLKTVCSPPPKSCVPEQYFKFKRSTHNWLGKVPLNPLKKRTQATMWVNGLRKNMIFIRPLSSRVIKPSQQPNRPVSQTEEFEIYKASLGTRTVFENKHIVSPTTVTIDPDLPSWGGIQQLINERLLRKAGNYTKDQDLIRFSEAFSNKYRSRFDPAFRFEPEIDFVLSPNFTGKLPRDLEYSYERYVTFLVTGKEPEHPNAGDQGRTCLFSEHYNLSQAAGTSKKWRGMCRSHAFWTIMGRPKERKKRLPMLQLKAAEFLETYRKRKGHLKNDLTGKLKRCKLLDIPDNAEVVVLALEHGRVGNTVSFRHCNIGASYHATGSGANDKIIGGTKQQCDAGQVDVVLDREMPVFLFLKGAGALQWNFKVSDNSKISGITTINDRRQLVTGLPEGVPFSQFVPRDQALPKNCHRHLLNVSPLVKGPSIPLFEMMLEQTSGRKIDVFISKGLAPDKADQTYDIIKDYTTFVVD